MINEVPEKLWTHLIVDFITKLLLVIGKDVILVVCQIITVKFDENLFSCVNKVKKWEIEKILNKRKIRGVVKYLVW